MTVAPRLAAFSPSPRFAELLRVDVRHVRRLVRERRIPCEWGHLLQFDPVEIARWVDHHRQPSGRENRSVPGGVVL